MLSSKVGPVSHGFHGHIPQGDGGEDVGGDEAEARVGEQYECGKGVDEGVGHPHPPTPSAPPPSPTGG